ncbi:MAG: hypothetical protein ACD_16C00067G0003 [uncultured bacterium]|nr:MAG: hypothetical protein ACD_16C00067G0003 [uncultured bacterium]OFW68809.1 MAG: hypothetical protein A2X70_00755 [Alphaproteobacteria bacterium GWC2_42_16]OFW73379.1 MAG: hypothetical protein A2Z80_02470 [Alphaproteobacteria bacterium GWA2_41_27]OFW81834.1 MAG: hypothetical protein A3E50_05025 [Alphaproteobacteria bacterium RIFCSPHIGHO2_12_FULL_42_100]OFW85845.1 MAG: hypothetical protein A2W06_01845 [Alphaproteobacteria bacterium RBG_16_42_14]OFW90897.1 MAG: hypothetical protein A3C41_072
MTEKANTKKFMSLTRKILLLIGFMFVVSVSVFLWFANKIMNHTHQFHLEQEVDAAQNQSLKEIKDKATAMKETISDDLQGMKEDFLKMQEDEAALQERFSRRQNEVFDQMDDFIVDKKRPSFFEKSLTKRD